MANGSGESATESPPSFYHCALRSCAAERWQIRDSRCPKRLLNNVLIRNLIQAPRLALISLIGFVCENANQIN